MHNKAISDTILLTATSRGNAKSTCPSEIARMIFPDDWREHMKEVIAVAIELQNAGKVLITHKGLAIDVNSYKGPIRIKIV
ncbi:DUF3253 domain-containing protein [Pedobacter jamesrossensis]|uniref:DUF3253 domain-containing protein n=1 Tax=Pedobacter jamesrossensis TaxID=1908238 RepID=A0ABV8NP23_9SPHI